MRGDTATCRVMKIERKYFTPTVLRAMHQMNTQPHGLQRLSEDTYLMRMDVLTEFRVWLRFVHTHSDIEDFLYNGIKN